MRRTTALFGTLTIATLIGIGLSGTAAAAEGNIYIDDYAIEDPDGCYTNPAPENEVYVDNDTDETVYFFESADCQGEPFATLYPGEDGQERNGSFYID